jgi:hypothetical protein
MQPSHRNREKPKPRRLCVTAFHLVTAGLLFLRPAPFPKTRRTENLRCLMPPLLFPLSGSLSSLRGSFCREGVLRHHPRPATRLGLNTQSWIQRHSLIMIMIREDAPISGLRLHLGSFCTPPRLLRAARLFSGLL